ncbi:uncharacterized protein ALTATR162_LOCUS2174 [Alternaria atra]|uniref:Uncharacterized protein n=1 Tax=Alternaria atra TaxID=119953 RepID=A0A8J2HXF8_9PLEO|nr:uncharacterized protein ALTATR162_LOCUS2174 [Alternaria atra]CAG5148255.1 unnamed protein product [Alternaria atra]
MDRPASSPQAAPPAYTESASDPYWKIGNTKYSSVFATNGPPSVEDYRTYAKHIKDSFLECGRAGSPASGVNRFVENVLHTIKLLNEEDVLFLLLSRYSRSSGACVYVEIKRPGEVQIFDSAIVEPSHMSSIQEHMVCAPGIITAEFHEPSFKSNLTEIPYIPVPQTPSAAEFGCSVTINFPEMLIVAPAATSASTANTDCPPTYRDTRTGSDQVVPVNNRGFLPAKLQPPAFRVHRCHHRGVERGGEQETFELPFGFPEVIQHMHSVPPHCYHIGFHIQNKPYQSMPCYEGGVQAFECHILPSETRVYITVEREGAILVYNCYRDEEVWARAHDNHEECTGCLGS